MSNILYNISEKFDSLTGSQRVVAEYLTENVGSIAFCTLDSLAAKIGVSTTTVIRFARAIGYNGYSEMQQDIQDNIRGKLSLPERYNSATSTLKLDQLLVNSFQADIENITETLASLDTAGLQSAVDAIIQANNVYLLGMRGSFSMAHLMASRLGQIKEHVRLIQAVGGIYPEEINGAGPGDLCISFMFPRYSKITASVTTALKERGVTILLITSPGYKIIEPYGNIILPCVIRSVSFKNSFVAPLCLINYLVTAVSMEDPQAEIVLSQTETMLDQGYYLGL